MGEEDELRNLLRTVATAVCSLGEGFRLTGLAIAGTRKKKSNFAIFEISDSEFVLMVRTSGVEAYAGIEGELLDDEMPEGLKVLISVISDELRKLKTKPRTSILYDNMSPDMKEFLYDVIMRHESGQMFREQFEDA